MNSLTSQSKKEKDAEFMCLLKRVEKCIMQCSTKQQIQQHQQKQQQQKYK